VKDPVCGMDVEPGHAGVGSAEHQGTTYWFCDPACRKKFVAEPARYLDSRLGPGGPDTRVYTCPMHSEVRQIGPGSCPKCGPHPGDISCQTQTPAAPGAATTVHISGPSRVERAGPDERHARPDSPPPSIGQRTGVGSRQE